MVWEEDAENVPAAQRPKHPAKVHVWGAFCYYGKLNLYVFEENLDQHLYIKILNARLPGVERLFPGERWMLLQDNDPKHTAKLVTRWLERNIPSFIPKDDWAPDSPDMNAIEPLWAILQDRVYARQPRTLAGLKRIIREEWDRIEPATLHNLVDSMSDRLNAVTAARGGHTPY